MPVGQNSELSSAGSTPEGYDSVSFSDVVVEDYVKVSFTRDGQQNTWEGKVLSTGYATDSRTVRVINIEGHGTVFSNEDEATVFRKINN